MLSKLKISRIPKMVFFDIEATGLHKRSFPVQFGWSGLDLEAHSLYVRPMPDWDESCVDPKAETIHGISMTFLQQNGQDAFDVARKLNEAFDGVYVISDNPYYELMWADRLFSAVGVKREFPVYDLKVALEIIKGELDNWCVAKYHSLIEALPSSYRHTHKAHEDAQHLAAMHRMLVDRDFAQSLINEHENK